MQRLIIQMAFATDLTGSDLQSAARTAMARALSQADLPATNLPGLARDACETRVTLGVPRPDAVDVAALEAALPGARSSLRVVAGGQSVSDPLTGARQDVVTAAAEVFMPRQSGWRLGARPADVASSTEAP